MLVPAGSSIFFLREHRFAVRCCVVTLRQLLWTLFTLLFMLNIYVFIAHIILYILHKYWMHNSILPFYDVSNFILCHLIVTVVFWPRS